MNEQEQPIPHLFIKPQKETEKGTEIIINYGLLVEYGPETAEHGRIPCHIVGFDIYYSATSENDVMPRGEAILKMWIDSHLDYGEKRMKRFSMALNRLGFRAKENESVMSNLLKSRVVKADFSMRKPLEPVFNNSKYFNKKSELARAV